MDYPTLPEPYFTAVVLQSAFTGSAGSTSFIEESLNTKTFQITGNTQISTTQSKWGTGSVYFDGTGDYLTITSDSDFVMGSSNFTIELWFNTTQALNNSTLISRGSSGFGTGSWTIMSSLSSGNPTIYWSNYSTSTPVLQSSTSGYNDGNWHHLAWVRLGNTHSLFLDGISKASVTTAAVMVDCGASLIIGNDVVYSPRAYQGYIQDIRITNGVGRYSSNFTPPTASFSPASEVAFQFYNTVIHAPFTNNFFSYAPNIIYLQSYGNTQIVNSEFKFSPGSVYFDGAGDYFAVPYTSDYDLSKPTYTIECWFKISSFGCNLFAKDTGGQSFDFSIKITNATTLACYTNGTLTNLTVTVPSINTAIWHHIAYVRNLGVLTIYLDGVSYGSSSMTITNASQSYMTIGCSSWNTPGFFVNGYIQDFRYVKNKAIYTSNFTPPTQLFDRIDFVLSSQIQEQFIQYNPAAISGSHIGLTDNSQLPMKDYEDGGLYFIEGNVTVDSTPSSRKVRLLYLNNGRLIKQTWSDPVTGYYKFAELKDQPYYVWSEDYLSSQEKSLKVVNNSSGNNFDFFSGDVVDVSASSTRYYFSGTAKLRNGVKANQVNLLSFPSGTFISTIIPDSSGNYSIYLNKGSEYIFLFIGPTPYKPESYYYKAPE